MVILEEKEINVENKIVMIFYLFWSFVCLFVHLLMMMIMMMMTTAAIHDHQHYHYWWWRQRSKSNQQQCKKYHEIKYKMINGGVVMEGLPKTNKQIVARNSVEKNDKIFKYSNWNNIETVAIFFLTDWYFFL